MGWNGRAVPETEGQTRAMFLSLQERLGRKADARERILEFFPEYADYLMNRLKKGGDGRVSFERARGKKPSVMGLEFGEKVLSLRFAQGT